MRQSWNFAFLLFVEFVLGTTRAQTSYYKRTYYNSVASPRYHQQHGLAALRYHSSDLLPEESKHKETPSKRYSKKTPYHSFGSEEDEVSSEHYTPGEYSNESPGFSYKENDSREYTIGTQIRVQHPISITKKPSHTKGGKYSSSHHYKPSAVDNGDIDSYNPHGFSSEAHESRPPPKKYANKYASELFDADPFHVVSPPKATGPGPTALASTGYSVYEAEEPEYDLPPPPPSTRTKSHSRDRFKGVASKKQIEKYLEDQQKLLDDALNLQLLNTAKFQKLLKTKEKEEHFEEQQYDDELPPEPLPSYRPNFDENITYKANRPRRRPHGGALKPRPPKGKPHIVPKPKRRFRSALVINV